MPPICRSAGVRPAAPRDSARVAGGAALGRTRRSGALPARRPSSTDAYATCPSVALIVATIDEA
eukprot:515765-Prymnesium_polylepis.1